MVRTKLIEHGCWARDKRMEICCVVVDSIFVKIAEMVPRFAYGLQSTYRSERQIRENMYTEFSWEIKHL